MAILTLRLVKGSILTSAELDNNFTNLNNDIASRLLASTYTASDILTKLKTVSGVGSGLDADTVRGLPPSNQIPVTPDRSSVVTRDSAGNVFVNNITGTLLGNITGTSNNVTGIVNIVNGGTGGTTPSQVLANIGAAPTNNPIFTGPITGNNSIELGPTNGTAFTPFIDFHSGAIAVDFDSRLVSTGGNGTAGNATLEAISSTFRITSFANNTNTLEINALQNTNGANIKLTGNGVLSPTKYIRSSNGNLEFVNNSYNAVLASLSDVGLLSLAQPLPIYSGGTGSNSATGTGSVVLNNGPLLLNSTTISGDAPAIYFIETDQAVNQKTWFVGTDGANYQIQTRNDDYSYISTIFNLNRAGTATLKGGLYLSGDVISNTPSFNAFRSIAGGYGTFIRNDGANLYLMQTNANDQYGSFNNFRPFSWNLGNGHVLLDGTGSGTDFGGDVTINGIINGTTSLVISNPGSQGANIRFAGSGGNKSIRAINNSMQWINNAYTAVIMTLDDVGNLTAQANVTAFSDIKYKTNIVTIPKALDKVNSLRGVSFDRTDIEAHQIGVIAQEIQKVLPEVVIEDTNGNLSVAYGNIVAVLIEAIKELSEKVKVLENK